MKEKILAAAKAAPAKVQLEEHREAVHRLREKGYTWREIADFLTEQGVQTDHTRVYRTFGKTPKQRTESRDIEISRITYMGERKTRKNNFWSVMEIEVSSKLGQPITLVGYAFGRGAPKLALRDENSVSFRHASLVSKTGEGYPSPVIKAELQTADDEWSRQDLYIVPKWEDIL